MNITTTVARVSTPNGAREIGLDANGRYVICSPDGLGEFVCFSPNSTLGDVFDLINTYQLW